MFSPTCHAVAAKFKKGLLGSLLLISGAAAAQVTPVAIPDSAMAPKPVTSAPKEEKKSPWYEKLSWRGYTQLRYNRLLETNPKLKSEYDRSIGDNGGFIIRRARLVLSGQVHERVYVYIQPD